MEYNNSGSKTGKICIISLGAYPLFTGKNAKNIIGPDVHQFLLAKELQKHDCNVSCVVYSEEEETIEYIDDIELIKIKSEKHTFRIASLFKKTLKLWNAMKIADSQIYFHAGGGGVGAISLYCKLFRKKYVYEIASDALVDKSLINKKVKEFKKSLLSLSSLGNWLDIKFSDAIIVQNNTQKAKLLDNFSKHSTLIKMSFPITDKIITRNLKSQNVLWVGSLAEVKQPELFIDLAKAIPEANFQMIAGYSENDGIYNEVRKASEQLLNFEFIGAVQFNEINKYYSQSAFLVNTSLFEGFPNSYLQAWINETPVITLNADPDEIICNYNLGIHSMNYESLIKDLKNLLTNESLCKQLGSNGRRYVENEHDLNKTINQYIQVFNDL